MPTSGFVNPPLLSPNTMIATIMRVAKSLGFSSFMIRKVLVKDNDPAHCAKIFAGYEPTEHDVFVATYSKSGTNWAMQIAQQILWHGEAEFDHIYDVIAWPDPKFHGIVPIDDPGPRQACPTGKRAIKTAIRAEFVPYSEKAVYLSVLRDPKEVFVSAYHFLSGLFELYDHIPVEEWLDMFLSNEFPIGPWPDHAASFWEWRDRPNVLIMPFRELKTDLPGMVQRAAETMRVELTEEQHAKVVERSSFAFMKSWEDKFRPPRFRFTKAASTMMRKGKSGGSSELISREQQARIDEFCIARLKEIGSDLPYEELFDVVRD